MGSEISREKQRYKINVIVGLELPELNKTLYYAERTRNVDVYDFKNDYLLDGFGTNLSVELATPKKIKNYLEECLHTVGYSEANVKENCVVRPRFKNSLLQMMSADATVKIGESIRSGKPDDFTTQYYLKLFEGPNEKFKNIDIGDWFSFSELEYELKKETVGPGIKYALNNGILSEKNIVRKPV